MVTAVSPACDGAAVALEVAGGEIVQHQREIETEDVVDLPEDILLQGFLVGLEVIQAPVIPVQGNLFGKYLMNRLHGNPFGDPELARRFQKTVEHHGLDGRDNIDIAGVLVHMASGGL